MNVPALLYVAAIKSLSCPECGCGYRAVRFGHKQKESPVRTGKSIRHRLAEWHGGADTGMSSRAIATVISMGGWTGEKLAYPHDPADLGRCLRLLRLIPEWKPRMVLMRVTDPVWAAMVDRWDDLEKSMTEEVGIFWEKGTTAPRTYALMRSIIEGVQ